MATASINKATSVRSVAATQNAQGASTFPSDLQALMNLTDTPDPGGGPPGVSAEAGASKLGPNAQSNQPDLLPLLAQAQANNASSKNGKNAAADPILLAMAGVVGQPASVPNATPVDPGAIKAGAAVVTNASTAAHAEQTAPQAAAANTQKDDASEDTMQVVVNSAALTRSAHPTLPAIQNSAVDAVVGKDLEASTLSIGTPTASDGPSQDASGGSGGGHTPNQSPGTPDPTGANLAGTASAVAPTASIDGAPALSTPTLTDPERLDVVRQVSDRIELMAAARPQQGVTIHLQPQGLGDVTIIVKGIGKDIEASFSVTNTAVRSALSDSRDALTQAVTAKGYNLVGVTVASHSQSMNGQGRQPSPGQQQSSQSYGNPSSGGGTHGGSTTRGGVMTPTAAISISTETDAEPTPVGVAGVDYRI